MADKYAGVKLPKLTDQQMMAVAATVERQRRTTNDQFPKRDPRRVVAVSGLKGPQLEAAITNGEQFTLQSVAV